MVHVGAVRQTAQITEMSTEALRTGDKAICHFRFVKNPEWLVPERRFVFREGRTKAVFILRFRKFHKSVIQKVGTVKELIIGPAPKNLNRHKIRKLPSQPAASGDSNRTKRKMAFIKKKTAS